MKYLNLFLLTILFFILNTSCGYETPVVNLTNERLYIYGAGAQAGGALSGPGLVFTCKPDGTSCSKFDSASLGLGVSDVFGYSFYPTKDNLIVGAYGINSNAGGLYKCNLEGTSCSEINTTGLNLIANDEFGGFMTASENNLYVSATGKYMGAGAVYKCQLDGANCSEMTFTSTSPAAGDFFGKSLYSSNNTLYVGAPSMHTGAGGLYTCPLNGTGCTVGSYGLNDSDDFGASYYATEDNLFVGAPSFYTEAGGVFKCDLDGTNCSNIITGTLNSTEEVGKAFAGNGNNLYVGAPGMHTNAGGVLKCDGSGANCNPIDTSSLGLVDDSQFGIKLILTGQHLYISAPGQGSVSGKVFICNTDGTNCKAMDTSNFGLAPLYNQFGANLFAK